MWWLLHTLGRLVTLVAFLAAALRVLCRLGGAMELRVSVRSLVHQLVHEQAKASVHLEGLQRDVTTLLDFRESVFDARPLTSAARPAVTVPSSTAGLPTDTTTTTDLASAGTSGLGTSTASSGTSAGASGVGGGGADQGAGAAAYRTPGGAAYRAAADGDELMSLLETIEARGRQLMRQKRRSATDGVSPLPEGREDDRRTSAAEATAGARPRCVHCDRVEGRVRDAGSNPDTGAAFGARRRPLDARRPSERLLGGMGAGENLSPLLPDWLPAWDRSAVCGDPPLSLPDLRPGQERLSALTLSERLLQERDALLEQLAGIEQVAVRSQLHAASLQTRLHRVLAVNDALDRELRLAGGQKLRPRPTSPVPAADGGRMARSTPDLRPPSRIPQPLSLRRQPAGRARSPHRVTGSRSRETQTSGDRVTREPGVVSTPRVVDRDTNSAECTTSVVETRRAPEIHTTSVGTSTASLNITTTNGRHAVESQTWPDHHVSGMHHAARAPSIRPPDRTRVSAILSETSPLKLQKELLTLLVEAEALRAQVDSLGRRWAARASSGSGEAEQASAQALPQADSDDIRLQLEMRNIELEGTRARLRQLESAWAARPGADVARSSDAGVSTVDKDAGVARRSMSPRPLNSPTLPIGRNPARSGNRLESVAEAGNQSDSLRRIARQPGSAPRVGDGADKPNATRRSSSPVRQSGNQLDSSLRPDRLPVSSLRSESQRSATSGSFHRPGASPTSRSDKRPDTPTRSSRSSNVPSRPGSRCDTPSGRPHSRPKTPTRPHSRTGLSTTPGNSLRTTNASGDAAKPASGSGSSTKTTSATGSSVKPAGGPGMTPKAGGVSGNTVRPVATTGRRVAELVRGWTESVEPQRHENNSPTGTEQPDHKEKVRRRGPLPCEPSAKIPATQSQALGQILTALSRGHSPRAPLRRAEPPPETRPEVRPSPDIRPGSDFRSAAEVRWLREATAQRLRQARLETSDGEVADSLTSATASEDGCDVSLEERLKLLEDGVGRGGGLRYGDGMVLSAGEGLIQRILSGRSSGQRVKPRPAAE